MGKNKINVKNLAYTPTSNYCNTINKIFTYKGKTFKIHSEIRIGGRDLMGYVMDEEGVFQFILGKEDVNYQPLISHVANSTTIKLELEKWIEELEKVIINIY